MGFGAELATLYVRLRPNLTGFGAEATAGVKRSMAGVTAEVNAAAKANIAATQSEIAANKALIVSYQEIAATAVKGSEEAALASKAATDTQLANMRLLGVSAAAVGAETSKLKGHVLGLGSALGLAFGADIAVKFVKDLSEGAAGVQKSTETIKGQFGPAGEEVVKFGEKGAHGLNITTEAADKASARFGILYKNLGIATPKAAEMTIGFEKLVGSLAKVRGIDPTPLLQNITLAAAGNTRGLKQLGIVVDNTSIKYEALKLGLISNISQAITPATKAQAIYALATKNLPQYLDQAKQHAGDLANVQRHLSVEWATAKEALGTQLLPVFSKYVGKLADYLTKMNNSGRLQHDFEVGLKDIATGAHIVEAVLGPLVSTLKAFTDAVGGSKNALLLLGGVLVGGKLLGTIGRLDKSLLLLKTAGGPAGAAGGVTKLGAALGTAGLVAEIGLASFAITSLILKMTGLDKKAREVGHGLADFILGSGSGPKAPGSGHSGSGIGNQKTQRELAALFPEAEKLPAFARDAFIKSKTHQNFTYHDAQVFYNNLLNQHELGRAAGDAAAKAAHGMAKALADEVPKTLKGLKPGQHIGDKALQNQLFGGPNFNPAKAETLLNNLLQFGAITADQYAKAQDEIIAKVKDKYAKLNDANQAGIQAAKDSLAQLHVTLMDAVKQEQTDVASAVDSAKQNLDSLGQSLASSIGSVLDKPLQDAQNKIQAATDKRSLEDLRRSAFLPGGKQLSKDPQQALAQLRHLAASAGAINKGAIQAFITQYQQAHLAVQQDQVNRKKDIASRSINDLTDSFKRGDITAKQFHSRVSALIKKDLPGYKKIGDLMGSAIAGGIQDNVKSLFAQAKALVGFQGGKGGAVDSKIVKPLDVLHKDQQNVAKIQTQIRDRHGALLHKIAKANEKAAVAAQKQAATLAQIAAAEKTSTAKNPGRQSKVSHHLTRTH